ncbi:formate dehydrogenase accessory sulfurtransferase FdhD [Aestuariivirga litoralis]|uniref:formate dehydrogenase accessory sulfurtransferase FdhD n=1 Tax=Aestuariivirga litoralis TaxID=2650924 RepID=UPI0018C46E10
MIAEASISASGLLNGAAATWLVPEEVPVAILLNSNSYAVMMATPADLEDFALGFVLSEGIVAHHSHVKGILLLQQPEGYSVDVAIDEAHLLRDAYVKRNMEGRIGCGLCGVAELSDALRMPRDKVKPVPLAAAAVAMAFDALPEHQPMNAANHSVHAAAFCSVDGSILLAREDVGRHNALDKVIGAMARKAQVPDDGFVLMSSRCSSELVQKCARVGLGALATLSAPTAFALSLARQAGISLASRAPQGIMMFGV